MACGVPSAPSTPALSSTFASAARAGERCWVLAEEPVRSSGLGGDHQGRRVARRRASEPPQVRARPSPPLPPWGFLPRRGPRGCSPAPPTWRRAPALAGLCKRPAGSPCGHRGPGPWLVGRGGDAGGELGASQPGRGRCPPCSPGRAGWPWAEVEAWGEGERRGGSSCGAGGSLAGGVERSVG